jgi:hypothetical protein
VSDGGDSWHRGDRALCVAECVGTGMEFKVGRPRTGHVYIVDKCVNGALFLRTFKVYYKGVETGWAVGKFRNLGAPPVSLSA